MGERMNGWTLRTDGRTDVWTYHVRMDGRMVRMDGRTGGRTCGQMGVDADGRIRMDERTDRQTYV